MEEEEPYNDRINFKLACMGVFPQDPPLLQELGIDTNRIKTESQVTFKALSFDNKVNAYESSHDLTGPVVFLVVYTLALILKGKLHCGYIYLISLVSTLSSYMLFNLMGAKGITLVRVCNILGYSIVPVVCFSLLSLLLGWTNMIFQLLIGTLSALWSSYVASILVTKHLELQNSKLATSYPLFLLYFCFILMALF